MGVIGGRVHPCWGHGVMSCTEIFERFPSQQVEHIQNFLSGSANLLNLSKFFIVRLIEVCRRYAVE